MTYYKILYRTYETMYRHQSAVVWDEDAQKMVDAVFANKATAEAVAQSWFGDEVDSWYIKSYRI